MRQITMAEAINEALREEMRKDPNMFILGEEIGLRGGAFTCTKGLMEEFPGRVLDTPISESAIAGAAYGAALSGTKAVAEFMFSDFSFIAMDQIINSAAKSRYMFGGQATIPVVFRMSSGSGRQQAAQHSQSLEVLYAHIPGLKVIMPSTPYDAKGLLKAAINDYNPVVFLEPRVLYFKKGEVPEQEYTIPIGKGDIKRSGEDVTVVATGVMVERSLAVAEKLAREGISVEVIDPRTIRPLDTELIVASVKKTGRLIVVHEAPRTYGMAGEIIALVMEQAFDYLNAPPQRVAGHDVPIPYNRNLEKLAIPLEEDIEAAVRKSLK
ncbi:Thiamin diphosphate-binding fold [Moorella glycerini]|uniref:2-oxoisovalerate dehydrogenase subunit beta n=1 Tax=Neomoorella stamsii TaxID=1266720 RepID=A0A9X7P5X9_9FIRM|nr:MULTISPECIES: alpha-ketoacid dehydrogenase subunit beta [Moorella]PRR72354.1 2-oxoisovalerate dehydrogenase subunit beta [Moorella stamsii]CEP67363.1 Thiamin diphosphate-binding fold [Moorella glycerini]